MLEQVLLLHRENVQALTLEFLIDKSVEMEKPKRVSLRDIDPFVLRDALAICTAARDGIQHDAFDDGTGMM